MSLRAILLALFIGFCLAEDKVVTTSLEDDGTVAKEDQRDTFRTLNTLLGSLKKDMETEGRSIQPSGAFPPFLPFNGFDSSHFDAPPPHYNPMYNPHFRSQPLNMRRDFEFGPSYTRQTPFSGKFRSEHFQREPFNDVPQPFIPRTQPFAPRIQPFAPRTQPFAPKIQPFAPRTQPFAPRTQPFVPRMPTYNNFPQKFANTPKFSRFQPNPQFNPFNQEADYVILGFIPRSSMTMRDHLTGRHVIIPGGTLPQDISSGMIMFHNGQQIPVSMPMMHKLLQANQAGSSVQDVKVNPHGIITGAALGLQGLFPMGIAAPGQVEESLRRMANERRVNEYGSDSFNFLDSDFDQGFNRLGSYRSDLPEGFKFEQGQGESLTGRTAPAPEEPSFFYLNPDTGFISPIWRK